MVKEPVSVDPIDDAGNLMYQTAYYEMHTKMIEDSTKTWNYNIEEGTRLGVSLEYIKTWQRLYVNREIANYKLYSDSIMEAANRETEQLQKFIDIKRDIANKLIESPDLLTGDRIQSESEYKWMERKTNCELRGSHEQLAEAHRKASMELEDLQLIALEFEDFRTHMGSFANLSLNKVVGETSAERLIDAYTMLFESLKSIIKETVGKKEEVEKKTGLGLSYKKDENFGKWYSEVVVSGELIKYHDIDGCYILQPCTVSILETMQAFLP